MRKLIGLALAGLLGLAGVGRAMAQDAVSGAVRGEQACRQCAELPAEVKIDLDRALLAHKQMSDEMSRLPSDEEAVLGESARPGELSDEQMQEMLGQLRARAELNSQMAHPNR